MIIDIGVYTNLKFVNFSKPDPLNLRASQLSECFDLNV